MIMTESDAVTNMIEYVVATVLMDKIDKVSLNMADGWRVFI